jgi:hypothetical protein
MKNTTEFDEDFDLADEELGDFSEAEEADNLNH